MDAWNYELPPALAAVRPAATSFREWAAGFAPDAAAADCEVALVEACNNLIAHNPASRAMISLRAEATPFDLCLIIRDTTHGFEWPREPKLPPPDAECGRGIFLIHTLMTQVEYQRASNGARGNQLLLRRRL
jgi:anti-sigma regulatory factor (Ser/Thr protein kinase)